LIHFYKRLGAADLDTMQELTSLWKEILSDLRERHGESPSLKDKNRILRNQENLITRQYASVVKSIGQLKQLLLESREAYMLGGSVGASGMSDLDMDQLDNSADEICVKCTELIQTFRKNIMKTKMSESSKDHYDLVGTGLADYLKKVVSIHSEMRAVRAKKQVQLKNLTKLELNSRESRVQEITPPKRTNDIDLQEKAITAAALAKSKAWESSDDEEEISPGEAQQLEMENERLIEHLNSLHSQVDQVTSKVVKISELQEIFSEKVLQQSSDIEHIHSQTVSTTENVKEGNEAVRQAIQNQASYRVIILFILLVFSFSLLFLDWYND